ncbi:MAG: T9SS type A sorting domain-containing protein [Saprospiraceae bacterium]|nr:T9SS type A sorting domain-containing protein [Saprospiraceae bacterium]
MKYTTYLTLFCLLLTGSVHAQYGDSLVLVHAEYISQLEAWHQPNVEEATNPLSFDISSAFLDGEEEVALFDYAVSPMYFTDKLQLSLPSEENFHMEIKNEQGVTVMAHSQMFGDNQLNLSHLAPGVYIIKLTCAMGMVKDTVIKI